MTQKTRWVVASLTTVGVLLGGVAGYLLPDLMVSLGFIGGLFLNALRLLILPLIVTACVAGVATLGHWRRSGSAFLSGLWYFALTTVVAVGLALLLVTVIAPGSGMSQNGGFIPSQVLKDVSTAGDNLVDRFIPSNQISAVLNDNYFSLILLSLFIGLGLAGLGSRQRVIVEFCRSARDTLFWLVRLLLYAAPVGMLFLVGRAVAQSNLDQPGMLSGLTSYLVTVFAALLIHGVIVLPLILKYFTNRSPRDYFGKCLPAIGTALGTGSSTATLPVTWECVVDHSRVDSRAGALVIPLGATINLDGAAIGTVVVTMFVAQVFGLHLSALQILAVVGATFVASISTAGLPGASWLMAVMVFQAAGFPDYAYAGLGLVAASEWLVERGRAAVSVWSDAVGAVYVEKKIRGVKNVRSKPATRTRTDSAKGSGRPDRKRTADDSRDRRRADSDRSGRDRGRRQSDDRRSGREHDRRDHQKRDHRPATGTPEHRSGRPADKTPASPFAVAADAGAGFDPDAPGSGADKPTGNNDTRSDTRRSDRADRGESRSTARRRPGPSRDRSRPTQRSSRTVREPKRQRREPETVPTGADSSEVPEPVSELTLKTIERERERVNAQLAALKENERLRDEESTSSVESDDKGETTGPAESTEPAAPKIDRYSGDSDRDRLGSDDDTSPARELASVAAENGEGEADIEDNGGGGVSYGRRRVRRGEKFKGESRESAESPEAEKHEGDEYSVNGQTFGRAKKKRIR